MITQYCRPTELAEAFQWLEQPNTIPLGGGTTINTPQFTAQFAQDLTVVDLQALGLDHCESDGNALRLGAVITLQGMLDAPAVWPALKDAIRLETTYNLRQMATLAGSIVSCDGRSPLAAALLALDAQLTFYRRSSPQTLPLGHFLPLRPRGLITEVRLPIKASLAFESVARTPADRPILCAAAAQWPSGRTRLAVGGWGNAPLLVMDGPEPAGAEIAARAACTHAGDAWASAEYRAEMAAVLTKRCLGKNQTLD
jgi:CO/xanthine dehydrogenase FAD-binding subunit